MTSSDRKVLKLATIQTRSRLKVAELDEREVHQIEELIGKLALRVWKLGVNHGKQQERLTRQHKSA